MPDDKVEQYPIDEIVDDRDRLAKGWMSVEMRDKDGDLIPISVIKKTLNTWMDRGAPMTDQHSNRIIGKGLRWYEQDHPESGKPGIIIEYKIYDDYPLDDEVWNEIKAGKRRGLSLGAQSVGKMEDVYDEESGETSRKIHKISLFEISPVDSPANALALNTAVNFLAKGKEEDPVVEDALDIGDELMDDLTKGYAAEDLNKPLAGFKDWDACFAAQREKGHDESSSERICGWLKSRLEKLEKKEDPKKEDDKAESGDVEDNNQEHEILYSLDKGGVSSPVQVLLAGDRFQLTDDGRIIWSSIPFRAGKDMIELNRSIGEDIAKAYCSRELEKRKLGKSITDLDKSFMQSVRKKLK